MSATPKPVIKPNQTEEYMKRLRDELSFQMAKRKKTAVSNDTLWSKTKIIQPKFDHQNYCSYFDEPIKVLPTFDLKSFTPVPILEPESRWYFAVPK